MKQRSNPRGKVAKKSSNKIAKRRRAVIIQEHRADDISESHRLERSLRESEERLGLVTEAVAEGIYDWNVELNKLFVSPRLMEIFSFEGSGLKSSGDWVARVHPDD